MTSAPGGSLTLVIQKPDLMRAPREIRSLVLGRICGLKLFPVLLENRWPTEGLLKLDTTVTTSAAKTSRTSSSS